MASSLLEVVDRLRRPEYTGQNRCGACTVVNLVLAVLLGGSLGAVTVLLFDPITGILLGGALFVLCSAAIYLRGYLVPGTPALTKTYFPDWVLRWFDQGAASDVGHGDDVDVERVLSRAGAVTECEHEDDLCLTEPFRAAWREQVSALRETDTAREELAHVFDVAPRELTFEEFDDGFVAFVDDRRVGQWPSRAAFLADAAGAWVLRTRSSTWDELDLRARSAVLNGLRLFLERCPACDGPVAIRQEVVESCCRSVDVVAVTCESCGARVFESEQVG